ncbi:MAG TPA: class I tRNA ligase family protein, partial [Chitinophagaceae bacterium]|nr:class I tRNA ligase family protein [Chitinophagaceae bacterium]
AYAIHPFSEKLIPVWISEYVLAGYGTGAIMAVPSGDERDHKFAQHFNIPITNIVGDAYTGQEAYSEKDFTLVNSDFINGLTPAEAAVKVINKMLDEHIGEAKVNFKMRDAAFSRQRYWGEPFPVRWKDGIAYPLSESELPLELPHVDHYGPGPDGEGPLANIDSWTAGQYETNTMPGYAGSSWYFLRYMDPHNEHTFADRAATDYWKQVDIYIGGTEHAVGHLLYSRMWTKALYDLGHISFDEPFKKLVNQGMIQGKSALIHRLNVTWTNVENTVIPPIFVSKSIADKLSQTNWEESDVKQAFVEKFANIQKHFATKLDIKGGLGSSVPYGKTDFTQLIRVNSDLLINALTGELNHRDLKEWREDFKTAEIITEEKGAFFATVEVEKMSKSKYNVVNPDDIIAQYGADTFRMYEMFLGPLDVSKPWDTKGIEGVHRFLKKFWRLYNDESKGGIVTDEAATDAELKVLHKTIKKIGQDTERFSFNTAVSQFMIAVNELTDLSCHKRAILDPLVRLITPYAPHMAEELWQQLGHTTSVVAAALPQWEERYVSESSKVYPVAINGKTRTELEFGLDAAQADIELQVLADETVQKWLEGKAPKKIIFVKGKMINVVI